ncbi:MAG: hypothetical protein M3Q27_11510 [Actinomycetota bacterium]|nr:hypothetical protein [Actinomycetota bacterium]
MLALAGVRGTPSGLAGVALFYGVYRLVLVVAETRLQDRIATSARSTVTSVAALVSEVSALAVYGAWAVRGLPAALAVAAAVTLTVPGGLRTRPADVGTPG